MDISDLPQIDAFLQEIAAKMGWDAAVTGRLRSAGEETLSSLCSRATNTRRARPRA